MAPLSVKITGAPVPRKWRDRFSGWQDGVITCLCMGAYGACQWAAGPIYDRDEQLRVAGAHWALTHEPTRVEKVRRG